MTTTPLSLQDIINKWIIENGLSSHFHLYGSSYIIQYVGLTCQCPMTNVHNFLAIKDNKVVVHSADFELKDTSYSIMAADQDFFSKLFQAMMSHCNEMQWKLQHYPTS